MIVLLTFWDYFINNPRLRSPRFSRGSRRGSRRGTAEAAAGAASGSNNRGSSRGSISNRPTEMWWTKVLSNKSYEQFIIGAISDMCIHFQHLDYLCLYASRSQLPQPLLRIYFVLPLSPSPIHTSCTRASYSFSKSNIGSNRLQDSNCDRESDYEKI